MTDPNPLSRAADLDPPAVDDWIIGYCTNVHAGTDLASIRDNLSRYAGEVRRSVSPDSELGVGLWLPDQAARQLSTGNSIDSFTEFLQKERLCPFTINGFPFDNFHQTVVKHRVYRPTWWQAERFQYTQRLAEILARLLPSSVPIGSISTLPIGWPDHPDGDKSSTPQDEALRKAGANLRDLANRLRDIEAKTGRQIVVAIEPEPGCVLDATDDVIDWFDQHLPETHHRRYLTVCHDVCHAAVMRESQSEVLQRLSRAGIGIGKVQVSSAIVADWDSMAVERRREAIEQLSAFAEDRYLHQTGRLKANGQFELAEDLPGLIASTAEAGDRSGGDPVRGDRQWVVHFHVPIFLERFGHLTTSRSAVLDCLGALAGDASSGEPSIDFTGHLEVETYAWTVLPDSMRKRGLAEDIASEIVWLRQAISQSI